MTRVSQDLYRLRERKKERGREREEREGEKDVRSRKTSKQDISIGQSLSWNG